jgi:spore coat polysaccharide biosynthesis predicted glycosyltransferase SpsG
MSSSNSLELTAKTKLAELSAKLDFVIKEVMEDMSPQEVTYVLENYSKYLTYDIKRNFEEKREKDLKESPFDAIINDDLGLNNE